MQYVTITLFKFEELNDNAQRRAIEDHREFILSTMQPTDFISGDPEYDTPECLQEIYEDEYQYYLTHDDIIIENIECNDYYFFYNGDLAHTVTYTAGSKKGKTVFKFKGETDVFIEGEN